jgi:hypothetical protein
MAGESFATLVRQYGAFHNLSIGPDRAWYSTDTDMVTLHGTFSAYELEIMMLAMREFRVRKYGPEDNAL